MFTCVFELHRLDPMVGSKLGFFLERSSFLLAGSSFWSKRSVKNHVAAFSTALRSATEKIELGGYVTVQCSYKMTRRSCTDVWLNF